MCLHCSYLYSQGCWIIFYLLCLIYVNVSCYYRDLKEHLRRLQQQSDTRRRQAVMEMMRQRAAEVAGNAGWAICTCKYDILLRNHQIFCAGLPGQLSITKQWWGEVVELDSCEVHSEYTTEWFVITCLLGNNLLQSKTQFPFEKSKWIFSKSRAAVVVNSR